jgi:hypothetical protein
LGVKDCGGTARYGIAEQAFAGQRLVRKKSLSIGLIFWLLLDQAKRRSPLEHLKK